MASTMSNRVYDIYIVEHVEEMKRENHELQERIREVIHENARLEAENYKLEGITKGGFR